MNTAYAGRQALPASSWRYPCPSGRHLQAIPLQRLCYSSRTESQITHAAASLTDIPLATDQDVQSASIPGLPRTYKRLVARRCGSSFEEVAVVQEVELRPPGPGEVLIRVTYAGINGGCETFRARGEHAFANNRGLTDFPLGAEGAGVVVAVGPPAAPSPTAPQDSAAGGRAARPASGALAVGQHVAVNGAAAFAEYVTARTALVTPVDHAGPEAVALVLSGVTACAALEATAKVRPGEVVVVTAAAGGTGHLALQLAAAAGCTAVAVVGGPAKAAAARELGAHHVIDYSRTPDVASALRELFPAGVDAVYEGVGGALRAQLLACLAPGGRLLQVGYISEYPHTTAGAGGQAAAGGGGAGAQSGAAPAAPAHADGTEVEACGAAGPSRNSGQGTSSAAGAPDRPAAGTSATAAVPGAASGPGGEASVPPCAELFWGGLDVTRGGQRIIGQIWPKDLKSILRCRRRVFELHRAGRLRVLTDEGHGQEGVAGVPAAVSYMLRGGHVGKVVVKIADP